MTEICTTCSKRDLCNSLCPEAELFASQDYVSQKELPIGLPGYGRILPQCSSIYLTRREIQISRFLAVGFKQVEIAVILKIKAVTVRQHVFNIRKKLNT